MENIERINMKQEDLEYAVSVIGRYTDDYLFFYDLDNDSYSISEAAVKKFGLPCAKFKNVCEVFKSVICEEDFQDFYNEIELLKLGLKENHYIEYRFKDKDGKVIWFSSKGEILPARKHSGNILFGKIAEIGIRRRADNLTGLYTEIQFISDYEKSQSCWNERTCYVFILGIENITSIYEKYGRTASDEVLKVVSRCIQRCMDKKTKVYRTDNDQFIIFCEKQYDSKETQCFVNELFKEIEIEETKRENGFFFSVKAGLVILENSLLSYSELRKELDFSLSKAYEQKDKGVFLYNQEVYEKQMSELDMVDELRSDIKENFRGFHVYYQPIVHGDTLEVQGAEALLRWDSKKFGFVSPGTFIPLLEESGLIIPVGNWIMRNAMNACKVWQQYIPKFHVNINMSYIQLKKENIATDIIQNLKYYELESKYVLLELTESGHVETNETVRQVLRHLHKKKVKFGIDDFGTGYSNFAYLQDLKVYIIKIDRSFVVKATKSSYHLKLLKHMIDMAHEVNLKVCIEGVETYEELQRLKNLGGDYYQGYYFGRPVDTQTFLEKNIKKTV